jgi:hypothetical protein
VEKYRSFYAYVSLSLTYTKPKKNRKKEKEYNFFFQNLVDDLETAFIYPSHVDFPLAAIIAAQLYTIIAFVGIFITGVEND